MKLEVNNLSKKIRGKQVLDGISLSLSANDSLAIRGSNGSGKTSLFNIIAGFDREYTGSLQMTGIRLEDIGYTPQDLILIEDLTVIDNINIFTNEKRKDDETRAKLIKILSLDQILAKKIKDLSGGQKRRVNFCLGMINRPKLILLDEIEVGIEEKILTNIVDYINEIKKDKILITSSHQGDFLKKIAKTYIEIKNGRIAKEGRYE